MELPKIDPLNKAKIPSQLKSPLLIKNYNKEELQASFRDSLTKNYRQQISSMFASMQTEMVVMHYLVAHPGAIDQIKAHMEAYWKQPVIENPNKKHDLIWESAIAKGRREGCRHMLGNCL